MHGWGDACCHSVHGWGDACYVIVCMAGEMPAMS